jgi:DNA-binding response OmpR family regulator
VACKRVLLVERDALLRKVLHGFCQAEGLDVRICVSLAELWSRIGGSPGDVALMDADSVDGLFGEEHSYHLGRFCQAVPVVLLADDVYQLDRRTMAELGVAAVLPKPFDLEQLMATLHAAASDPTPAEAWTA